MPLCFLEVHFISSHDEDTSCVLATMKTQDVIRKTGTEPKTAMQDFSIKHKSDGKRWLELGSTEVNKARPMSEVDARKKESLKISHDEDTRRDKENRNRTQNRNAGL